MDFTRRNKNNKKDARHTTHDARKKNRNPLAAKHAKLEQSSQRRTYTEESRRSTEGHRGKA